MAVKQLPKISDLPEPPDRLVGDQERFDVLTFNSLKAQKKMVNEDLNKTLIPALNEFAVDVNASVDAAKASETSALASKNAAASSAATATTKAGEAAASAKAAKTSETNALASKNAASSSATAAANAQKAAEAARDEAQDLANVGYASESHAGLSKVDGKTTQADAGGVITVKDVAIGGDLEDLASARGYLVDEYLPEFPSRTVLSSFDDATTPGNFHVLWDNTTTSAPDGILNKNQYADGVLEVRDNRSASFVSSFARLMQRLTIIGGATRADSARIFVRTQSWGVTREWFPWVELVSYNKFGDGFRNTNGIISVPEYDGATASTAGTSGLVPPATAGQHESFLTGSGEYKPALTKISDSVSLADSTTAASAKAVKTAYELAADAKQKSNTSGTADYANGLRGIPLQWVGRDASPEFLLGRLGQEPFDAFRPMHIEGVGSAKAWKAQNSGGNYVLYDEILGENPTYIMGYALNGIFKIYTTSALSVNYANNAGQAQLAAPAVQWVVNTSGPAITVPQGGTYNVVCICFNDSGGKGAVKHYPNIAGGTVIPNAPTDYMVAGLCARVA